MDDYSIVLDTFKMIYLEVRDYRIRGAVRPNYHQPMHFCMGLSGNLSLEQGGIFFYGKKNIIAGKEYKSFVRGAGCARFRGVYSLLQRESASD